MYKTQSPKNVNNPVKIWNVLFMQNRYYCLLFYFRFQIDNSFEFYILVLQNSKFLDAVASLALKDESQSVFLCLKVILDTFSGFWFRNSFDFGKVQFCSEWSNFSQFYPILATGEDFSTIVRLLYKPW